MDKLEEALSEYAREGRITCKQAFEIADRLNLSPGAVGKKINELGIKIKGCQLGCF